MNWFRRRPRLGRSSVKEAFDNLPSGICFADRNGLIILCNRQMHSLCWDLLGTDLQHLEELRRALKSPQPGVTAAEERALLFRFPDGKLWQFAESAVTGAGIGQYTQVQAIDVTELHEKRGELEWENQALAEANARARRLYLELDQIVREKERLAMKMKVHDNLGLCLLSTRNLLAQNSSLEDFRKGGKRWEQALQLIDIARSAETEDPIAAGDALSALIASAAEIVLQVYVKGDLPRSGEDAYLLIVAMRECVTNTVRHARGSKMDVVLTQAEHRYRMAITNNGKKPDVEIVEGGGLSALRRRIEDRGGNMAVESSPEFRLIVLLPEKEETR